MLRINERSIGEGVVLELEGDLRTPHGALAFFDAVARCVGEGRRLVIADLSTVRNADAAGLGALVRARVLLDGVGGELHLINPNGFVRELLRLTRLHTILKIVPAVPPKCTAGSDESRVTVSVRSGVHAEPAQ